MSGRPRETRGTGKAKAMRFRAGNIHVLDILGKSPLDPIKARHSLPDDGKDCGHGPFAAFVQCIRVIRPACSARLCLQPDWSHQPVNGDPVGNLAATAPMVDRKEESEKAKIRGTDSKDPVSEHDMR